MFLIQQDTIERNANKYKQEFVKMDKIGQGGFSQVFRCKNTTDDQLYAIKTIKLKTNPQKSNQNIQKSLREPQILAQLEHPNLLRYYSSWVECSYQAKKVDRKLSFQEPINTLKHSFQPKTKLNFDDLNDNIKKVYTPEKSIDSCSSQSYSFESELEYKNKFEEDTSMNQIQTKKKQTKLRELQDLQQLNIPNTKSDEIYYDARNLQNVETINLYIQTELCEETLKDYIVQRNEILQKHQKNKDVYEKLILKYRLEACKIILQLISALQYLHCEKNVIHRDLKPTNVFLNKNLQVKLGDFGLAIQISNNSPKLRYESQNEDETQISDTQNENLLLESSLETSSCGTLTYASPEQITERKYKRIDCKTDIYSLSVIFLELFLPMNTMMETMMTIRQFKKGTLPSGIDTNVLDLMVKMIHEKSDTRPDLQKIKSVIENYNRNLQIINQELEIVDIMIECQSLWQQSYTKIVDQKLLLYKEKSDTKAYIYYDLNDCRIQRLNDQFLITNYNLSNIKLKPSKDSAIFLNDFFYNNV